jgi:general secretion pathway protein N
LFPHLFLPARQTAGRPGLAGAALASGLQSFAFFDLTRMNFVIQTSVRCTLARAGATMSLRTRVCVVVCSCVVATASAFGIAYPAELDGPGTVAAEQRTAPEQDLPVDESGRSRDANPLWSIPLQRLSETRDRPIFSLSRRPPPPDAPPPAAVVAPAAQAPAPPERPQLSLLGTVMNGEKGLAVFLDQGSNTSLRIRIGGDYQGWTLRQVEARSVTLQKGQDVAVLALPAPTSNLTVPAETNLAQPSTSIAPPPVQAEPPYLSPESRTLRRSRQRSGRRQL